MLTDECWPKSNGSRTPYSKIIAKQSPQKLGYERGGNRVTLDVQSRAKERSLSCEKVLPFAPGWCLAKQDLFSAQACRYFDSPCDRILHDRSLFFGLVEFSFEPGDFPDSFEEERKEGEKSLKGRSYCRARGTISALRQRLLQWRARPRRGGSTPSLSCLESTSKSCR